MPNFQSILIYRGRAESVPSPCVCVIQKTLFETGLNKTNTKQNKYKKFGLQNKHKIFNAYFQHQN